MRSSWVADQRAAFHAELLQGPLTINDKGVPSNADSGSKGSVRIARSVLEQIGAPAPQAKQKGQSAGTAFEVACEAFLNATLSRLAHLRPGLGDAVRGKKIFEFSQYEHLEQLEKLARGDTTLAAAMGSDYVIKPDIVIPRHPEDDDRINAHGAMADDGIARLTRLRRLNGGLDLLHASISCKWTIRSDRAQNARSEGLIMVRNRKDRLPHITVITGEPLAGRIASLALGTGDIDCVYHFALPELREAINEHGSEDAQELMSTMVDGKRLRDIADLPFDLLI